MAKDVESNSKPNAAPSAQGAPLKSLAPDRRSARMIRRGKGLLRCLILAIPIIAGLIVFAITSSVIPVVIGVLLGLLLVANFHVVMEWESATVFRFGKLNKIKGPGAFFTIPFVEFVGGFIDRRISATPFKAECTLTADNVPVTVDAVLFWMVWDAKSACTEVKNYRDAAYWAAQTTLRDVIGSVNMSELSTRRESLDKEIRDVLVAKTESWGITIVSVEIRDITIPETLQDALSKEAQAERERNARITLAEAEEDVAEMFVRASQQYANAPESMQLRAMNMLYDGIKEHGGTVIVPNSLVDAFSIATSRKPEATDK